MRLHVVSDVHGATDALARAGDGADALLCLGDLALFLDYDDHGAGIFPDLFGREAASEYVRLRTARRWDDARAHTRALWDTLDGEPRTYLEQAVRRQYADLFAVMPKPTYLTYGNVDLPRLWPEFLREGQHHLLDGEVIELGGLRFGFVGGGLRSPMRTPYELTEEEYAAKVAAVGAVDVLCAHLPPAVPELCYDVVARRFERGSTALLEAVRETQPRLVLSGHVHQPLVARTRIGRTECVNVGHFRSTGVPYVLEWDG
ncbi:MAG: metallophosphoesterase family protein [Actinomycetes bacterium]